MTSPKNLRTRANAVAEVLIEPSTERSQVCYRLSLDRRDQLHRLALERRTKVQGLIDEAVGDLLAKYGVDH